jgi:2-desacetyl-2-hydroxyethyl bacteriochlorophyllide A dehydrogenase
VRRVAEARAVYFTAPGVVEIRDEPLPSPGPGQALVRTRMSAISAGTELLIYRGQAPTELDADETLAALPGSLTFPIRYGYACVGDVSEVGPGVEAGWHGQTVFAFHPHQDQFVANTDALIPLPPGLSEADGVFLPNLETAISLVHDARPILGERIVVFGQGVVGLLTTSMLARMDPERLVTADPIPLRRETSLGLGAHAAIDPGTGAAARLQQALGDSEVPREADLAIELSGNPAALDLAISITGYDGRIVVGSWYGRKGATLDLGGRFHRNHIQLTSSQVSRLPPTLRGRWTKVSSRIASPSTRRPTPIACSILRRKRLCRSS